MGGVFPFVVFLASGFSQPFLTQHCRVSGVKRSARLFPKVRIEHSLGKLVFADAALFFLSNLTKGNSTLPVFWRLTVRVRLLSCTF